jgi:predicted nuclease with TOPRIM domain
MSTFGWSPNEHRDELPKFSPNPDGVKPIQDVSIAEYAAQFAQRQEHEDAMKDTVAVTAKLADETMKLAEEIERADGLVENIIDRLKESRAENGLLRRSLSVLNNRVDELETEIDGLETKDANLRADAEALLERLEHIAAVLKTFYFAELSMSSVQPILALAIEFNPDIIEQRR